MRIVSYSPQPLSSSRSHRTGSAQSSAGESEREGGNEENSECKGSPRKTLVAKHLPLTQLWASDAVGPGLEAGKSEQQEKALGPSLGEVDRYGNDIITTDCEGCHDTGVYKVLRESENAAVTNTVLTTCQHFQMCHRMKSSKISYCLHFIKEEMEA